MNILPPKNDAVFKRLMGDSRDTSFLVGFLQAALDLPPEDYDHIQILDPHVSGNIPEEKMGVLDVRLETATGKQVDIEIQLAALPEMPERLMFYLGRMITGQIGKGQDYGIIKRSICILIADYVQLPGVAEYHNRFMLYNPKNGARFSDLLEVDTLELPKLPKEGDGTKLYLWVKFFRAREEEEFDMLAKQDTTIGAAVGRLKELSQDEALRMLAESRQMAQWDEASRLRGARKEGMKEGRKEGQEEGRKKGREEALSNVARKLIALNLSIENIAAATGLSVDEIQALQK
jgi:predicted transposase/invertase (TIGR01784 family)